jgi:hypothetical protein
MINPKNLLLSMAMDALNKAVWELFGYMTEEEALKNETIAEIHDVVQRIKKELARA